MAELAPYAVSVAPKVPLTLIDDIRPPLHIFGVWEPDAGSSPTGASKNHIPSRCSAQRTLTLHMQPRMHVNKAARRACLESRVNKRYPMFYGGAVDCGTITNNFQ